MRPFTSLGGASATLRGSRAPGHRGTGQPPGDADRCQHRVSCHSGRSNGPHQHPVPYAGNAPRTLRRTPFRAWWAPRRARGTRSSPHRADFLVKNFTKFPEGVSPRGSTQPPGRAHTLSDLLRRSCQRMVKPPSPQRSPHAEAGSGAPGDGPRDPARIAPRTRLPQRVYTIMRTQADRSAPRRSSPRRVRDRHGVLARPQDPRRPRCLPAAARGALSSGRPQEDPRPLGALFDEGDKQPEDAGDFRGHRKPQAPWTALLLRPR